MGVLKKLKQVGTAIENVPRATKVFGTTLVSEAKKELDTPGSAANRFADAPLGQYYLPRPVRKAVGFVAPSPRKVARDTSGVVKNPSAGNIAAEAGNVLSIATLPAVGAGAVKGAKVAGRAAAIANEAKALPLGERIGLAARGALNPDALYHGTTQSAAKAIRTTGYKGTDVFLSRQPGVAAAYAELRGSQLGERPAVVLTKIAKGASVVKKGQNYAEVVAPKAAKPIATFPDTAANMARRVKGRVFSAIGEEVQRAAKEGQHARDLPGKIQAVRQELVRLKTAPGNVTQLPRAAKTLSRTLPSGLKPGEKGALGGSEEVVRRANAALRGKQFAKDFGKLQEIPKGELKARTYAARNFGFGESARSESKVSMAQHLQTLARMKTHARRIPRN